jgi:hypothetical protein
MRFETPTEKRTMPTVKPRSRSRPPPSRQRFALEEPAPFAKEGTFASNASRDLHLFYVGRDDVHGVLKHLFSRPTTSVNILGYDDEKLNAEWTRCASDATIDNSTPEIYGRRGPQSMWRYLDRRR